MAKTRTLLIIIALITVVAACNSRSKRVKLFPEKIVGRWELTRQLMVTNAYEEAGKKDTTVGLQEQEYQPAQIEFGVEGTYLLVIKDYEDNIKLRRPGKWEFSYDTLFLKTLNGETVTDTYMAEDITDSTMQLKIKVDIDDDGKDDDEHTGYYIKVRR